MSVKVDIRIIRNEFPQASGKMTKAIGEAFQSLGADLLAEMQGRTPVDTGELRGSESVAISAKQLTLSAGAEHGKYVEFGTYKMAAQPFMKPTVDGASGKVAAAISEAASAAFG